MKAKALLAILSVAFTPLVNASGFLPSFFQNKDYIKVNQHTGEALRRQSQNLVIPVDLAKDRLEALKTVTYEDETLGLYLQATRKNNFLSYPLSEAGVEMSRDFYPHCKKQLCRIYLSLPATDTILRHEAYDLKVKGYDDAGIELLSGKVTTARETKRTLYDPRSVLSFRYSRDNNVLLMALKENSPFAKAGIRVDVVNAYGRHYQSSSTLMEGEMKRVPIPMGASSVSFDMEGILSTHQRYHASIEVWQKEDLFFTSPDEISRDILQTPLWENELTADNI